jgi:integrase
MSIRWRHGRPIVEVYDPATKAKRHVRPAEFDMEPPPPGASQRTLERWARRLEAAAEAQIAERRRSAREETCAAFGARWTTDFPRGESTNKHNEERISAFITDPEFAARTVRSITKPEARAWGRRNKGRVSAVRAMFSDAVDEGLSDENPFAGVEQARTKGREDITVLTKDEVARLAEIALEVYGPDAFGRDVAAMVTWGAYTCCRPGETFAARYSRLSGDTYDLRVQFNSTLGKETPPKHGSTGVIFVPEEAQRAVLDKPRRLGDDLMFRTKRGHQFRQGSLHHAWSLLRTAFVAELPASHHLRQRLAIDPEDRLDFYELRHFGASYMLNVLEIEPWIIGEQLRHHDGGALVLKLYGHREHQVAIDRIRRAFGGNVRDLRDAGDVPKANGEAG